jgi:hypothetical protein
MMYEATGELAAGVQQRTPHSSLGYGTSEEFGQRAGYADVESKGRFPHPHSLDYEDCEIISRQKPKLGNSSKSLDEQFRLTCPDIGILHSYCICEGVLVPVVKYA